MTTEYFIRSTILTENHGRCFASDITKDVQILWKNGMQIALKFVDVSRPFIGQIIILACKGSNLKDQLCWELRYRECIEREAYAGRSSLVVI